MHSKLSSAAIEALRSTLEMVEQQCGLAPDDPALLELKRILLSRIAELEAIEFAKTAEQLDQKAVNAALELAVGSGAVYRRDDPPSALAIDLAVSLLADRTTGRPFEARRISGSTTQTGTSELAPVPTEGKREDAGSTDTTQPEPDADETA